MMKARNMTGHTECTFLRFLLKFIPQQLAQHKPDMLRVFFYIPGEDENIIQIHKNETIERVTEDNGN